MTFRHVLKNTFLRAGNLRQPFDGTNTRRATIASLMSGGAGQVVLVITGVLAARILGVNGRGSLAILTVFAALVAQVGGLGLPQAATYYISKSREAWPIMQKLRPLMIAQTVFLSAIHLIIVVIYVHNASWELKIAAFYTLFAAPGNLARAYGQSILLGQGRYRLFNSIRLLPVVSYAILLVFLFITDRGSLPIVAAVWSISNLLTGVLVLFLAYWGAERHILQYKKQKFPSRASMTVFGLKGLFGWSSPLDSFRIDHLIAGLMLSSGALGLYVVGQAFTNIPKFISQSIGMIAYPTISGKEDLKGIKNTIWWFVLASGALNILIVGLLWLAMPFLVRLFFGEEFTASIPLARILILGALMLSFRRIIVECARGLGRSEISTYAELSMYPCFLVSIPFLIIPFGITGMATTVVGGQFVSLLISFVLTKKILKQFLM